ncbi:MAG TPA: hypothetical protein VF791_22160 [Pyrinomonadaceae bacterium]
MVALLITTFFLLAGITYAFYLRQRSSSREDLDLLLPPPANTAGLFGDRGLLEEAPAPALAEEERKAKFAELRRSLISRAASGDREALREAQATADDALYDEVLDALVNHADSEKSLFALVSFIARSDAHLRVNRRLAEKFMESWKTRPDRNSTAQMLHVAAVADDAGVYQRAVETAYEYWRDRRLQGIHADELRQLFESEFWLLAPATRNSGAGFVLKRTLAQLRRKLAAERDVVNRES